MQIVMPDDEEMPEPFTYDYNINTKKGSLTVETLDEYLINKAMELKVKAWYKAFPNVASEKLFIIEIAKTCNPLFKVEI